MATGDGKLTIINLGEGGGLLDFWFPEKITSDDRANWEAADVANGLKPLFYANNEPQKISVDELCIDNTRTNESVEPIITKLRSWMRVAERGSAPPPLLFVASGFNQRVVLTELNIKRSFFTSDGICIRAYFSMTFEELPSNGLQVDVTTQRRSGNSISGRTFK